MLLATRFLLGHMPTIEEGEIKPTRVHRIRDTNDRIKKPKAKSTKPRVRKPLTPEQKEKMRVYNRIYYRANRCKDES